MKCLICGSDRSKYVTAWEQWQFERCRDCGVFFTIRVPEEEVVSRYISGSLLGDTNDKVPAQEMTFPAWKHREHDNILDRLGAIGNRGKLLDVGCLWGSFLNKAHRKGFDVVGVEPFAKAVAYVNEVLKLTAFQGTLRSVGFVSGTFDVVTFLDVIEHLPDPVAEVKEAYRVTKLGGLLVLNTPDVGSLIPRLINAKHRLFGEEWPAFDSPPWHLWGFTRGSIRRCAENGGYTVESLECIEPSLKTTNDNAGGTPWKRAVFRCLGFMSAALGISDRVVVFARKSPI